LKRDRELLRRYLDENPEDELRPVAQGEGWVAVSKNWLGPPKWGSEVVHHVIGCLGGKYDILSLMVTVDAMTHEWVHLCPKHGVVASLYIKAKKGEFDREHVKEVTGRDVIAIIDYWVDSGQMLDTYYVFLAEELISMVSE
jgi:hypothetical protein